MSGRHFIGNIAKRFGLNPRTLRYYETIGILPRPQRTEARYRVYTDDFIDRLEFILKAKAFGLTLEEIKQIISIYDRGELPCDCTRKFIRNKIAEAEEKISALIELKSTLAGLLKPKKYRAAKSICPIITEGQKRLDSPVDWIA